MNKTLKIITIIGVLCMLVPFMVLGSFASAETVTEDGAEFIFREFHGVPFFVEGVGDTYAFDTDNAYFGYGRFNIPNLQSDVLWRRVNSFNYELSLSGSPFVSFAGDYALFTMRNFNQGSLSIYPYSDDFYDGRLHSMCLLFAVPVNFPYDVQDGYFSFTGVDFWDDSSLVPITMSVIEPVAPSTFYTLQFSGSGGSSSLSAPSVSFFSQLSVSASDLPSFQQLSFYALTWYHTPTYYTFSSNYPFDVDNQFADLLFVISFVDMVSYNTGYETGYREGVTAGRQQGYDEGFTAGEQQGYNQGVTDGKYQANNTVNTGSASYIKGYQDGLDAPEYSFMSLISAIIDAPIRAFFGYTEDGVTHPGLFNFTIFDYDMSSLVLSIFSLCVLITILRLILGGK